ncbi:MAG: hypothetical protein HYY02_01515 [Chloroflexi bacterium]|nr:hypothetical protein [Chloroflexota bacterium]
MHEGELAPEWRFLLATAIVLGLVGVGFVLIYMTYLLAPLVLAGVVGALIWRWLRRR